MASQTTHKTQQPIGRGEPLLVEIAWEVVNQVGGIYTVIRTKLPRMCDKWDQRYCLVGPYNKQTASVEFEERPESGPFGKVAVELRKRGIQAHYGTWIVTGRPRVVLLELGAGYERLPEIRHRFRSDHAIELRDEAILNDVAAFGWLVEQFLEVLGEQQGSRPVIAHFHEWMGGAAIPVLRRRNAPISLVFTTHATMLGRYIAANDPWYYDHVPFVDWSKDAGRFNIQPQVLLERAAAHGAHVFTTVSHITAFECQHLLGRAVDVVTPNALNIERFTALHEFQDLHRRYKEQIHQFVMGHFFPSYSFDLDRTLYLFTSGRYEYVNKGFDMTVEALARLNWRMKQAQTPRTVVFFFITKRPTKGLNSEVVSRRAVMNELRQTCDAIKDQVGQRLFYAAATDRPARLDELVDDYWRLRLRRTVLAWKTGRSPDVITHDLEDSGRDELLNKIRACNLLNHASDPVKVVYHPDFITASNPLWGLDYDQFVRGCHMGVFPSFYEPWGYTPLECIALGIPAVSSDVSGFGSYVLENAADVAEAGVHVLRRRYCSYDEAANSLADHLFKFAAMDRRQRIALRNRVDQASERFDWKQMARSYDQTYDLALQRL